MNNIVKLILFSLLLCHNVLGFNFDNQDANMPPEKTEEAKNPMTSNTMKNILNFPSSDVWKSTLKRRKSDTKLLTTPLLPDDLTLVDDLHDNNASEQNSIWTSLETTEHKSDEFSVDNLITSQSEMEDFSETFKIDQTSDLISTDLEGGSGDLFSTTSGTPSSTMIKSEFITSFTPGISSTIDGNNPIADNILESCFDTVCNSTEIQIDSKNAMFVPKSTNVNVICTSLGNNTNFNNLHWYFVNETEAILKYKSENQTLSLQLNSTEIWDSGTYKCLKFKRNFCCHTELFITVYEAPNYKIHLLIAGSIAVLGFALCISLTVRRTAQLKKYVDLRNAKEKQNASLMAL